MEQELAERDTNGTTVILAWDDESGGLTVAVHDWRSGESFQFGVEPAQALDAFHHPYAYAARRGILAEQLASDVIHV